MGWQTGEVRRGRDAAGPGDGSTNTAQTQPGRSLGIGGGAYDARGVPETCQSWL